MFRQPDQCFCFGGSCWRKYCPDSRRNTANVDKTYQKQGEKRSPHNKIRTLSESRKEMGLDKDE